MYVLGVHGRTREQKDNTSTRANWDAIKVSLCCAAPAGCAFLYLCSSCVRGLR